MTKYNNCKQPRKHVIHFSVKNRCKDREKNAKMEYYMVFFPNSYHFFCVSVSFLCMQQINTAELSHPP